MNNIVSSFSNAPKYVDFTKSNQALAVASKDNLTSQATTQEQIARDRAAQSNGLLSTTVEKVISPSSETVNQLQKLSSSQYPDNANGLGRAAIQSYGQYSNSQIRSDLADHVKVDISA